MKLNLTPKSVYGSIQYEDKENRITASQIDGKWYPTIETDMFDAGFSNIACMSLFVENLGPYTDDMEMLGYRREGNLFISDVDPRFHSEVKILDEGKMEVTTEISPEVGRRREYTYKTTDTDDLIKYILDLQEEFNIDIFSSIIISNSEDVQYVIEAKMSTRDLTKNLVRVKSSNIWSYGINIRDRKDKKGDVLIQFKDSHGGPGDLYQYFDVDIKTWRKMLSATSKGHAFWVLIRDNFQYAKLTGDKKGKLPNAVNNK